MNSRAEDLLRRANRVRDIIIELEGIRTRLLALGLSLAPQIDALVAQSMTILRAIANFIMAAWRLAFYRWRLRREASECRSKIRG